jgi:hypothetical protein
MAHPTNTTDPKGSPTLYDTVGEERVSVRYAFETLRERFIDVLQEDFHNNEPIGQAYSNAKLYASLLEAGTKNDVDLGDYIVSIWETYFTDLQA